MCNGKSCISEKLKNRVFKINAQNAQDAQCVRNAVCASGKETIKN